MSDFWTGYVCGGLAMVLFWFVHDLFWDEWKLLRKGDLRARVEVLEIRNGILEQEVKELSKAHEDSAGGV